MPLISPSLLSSFLISPPRLNNKHLSKNIDGACFGYVTFANTSTDQEKDVVTIGAQVRIGLSSCPVAYAEKRNLGL